MNPLEQLARLRGGSHGLFFLSHHPWVGVVLLVAVIVAVMYLNQRRR